MADLSQRNLRVRKNPKYLNSDEQDPDKVSFSQLKSHHDYSSSNHQRAQDAKVLVKLINKINKNFRTYVNEAVPISLETQKKQTLQKNKKNQIQQQPVKKPSNPSKEPKTETVKQKQNSKPMYNFKSQFSAKDSEAIRNSEAYVNKLKQIGSISGIAGVTKGLYSDQLKKLQNMYPEMKNLNYQTLTQNTNPNLFGGSISKQQKSKKQGSKPVFAQQKLFKRSAYHVAIAYHIYLKNLKQRGGPIGNQIDPTYHAKKLKQLRPGE